MYYLLIAAICAVIGVVPLILKGGKKAATILFCFGGVAVWLMFWDNNSGFIYPFFGGAGLVILLFWVACAAIDVVSSEKPTNSIAFPLILLLLYFGSAIMGSGMLRANDYANLIGPIDKRVWTQDIQPKDPKHMAMVSQDNAIYVAKKVIGEAGAIGSQFSLATDHPTPQMLNGELWYVIPLDYNGFMVWWTDNKGVPGYIKVHAEDVNRKPEFVQLPDGQKLRYTPKAYWGTNLTRHIRNLGYLHCGLTDYSFEIDDATQKPHWVITTYEPTIMWGGEKVTGILIVDPITGDITTHTMADIPHWVDRVIPSSYVKSYLTYWGKFQKGWNNSRFAGLELTEPEEPNLIYGSDNEPYFVTGITSNNEGDDSLIGLMYTHTRTGKSIFYETKGGGTDAAVMTAVDKNSEVQFRKLHGAYPQLYNVHGIMTSVVPLYNDSHSFQGVAMVNIKNIQMVAVGKDQHDAMRIYQKLLAQAGHRVAVDKEYDMEVVNGEVDRINQEVVGSTTVYYVHLKGIPHLYTGGSEISSKLPVTQVGDKLTIGVTKSGQDVVPMDKFDNLSLTLVKTADQTTVENNSIARKDKEVAQTETNTIVETVKTMSPEELKEMYKKAKH